jgi:Icc-related predicted phosphoesterase
VDLVIISDIHGDVENLLSYLDKIKEFKFDVVVCPGDFTDVTVPRGFTQEDVAKLIIKGLKILGKPLLCVPGNVDTRGVIDVLEKEDVNIHGKGVIINDYGFYAYGGAKTPFQTNIEPSEEEIKSGLNNGLNVVKDQKNIIQITHNPPYGTKMDLIQTGIHVGSKVVRQFIENNKPLVAISSHIHESKGIDKLNNTFLLNSGKFSEGYFGLINIEKQNVMGKVLSLLE